MASEQITSDSEELIEIDLKNRTLAAFLAWLWPGAGHAYQQRYGKAILFMVCILGTYFFGLTIGEGHVVYAAWQRHDHRWQYGCQVWVGLPALPAVVQTLRVRSDNEPWFNGFMAPPENVVPDLHDELASWHKKLGAGFELGTLYTVVAGLLNVLVIYDAYSGPFLPAPEQQEPGESARQRRRKRKPND